MYNLRQFFQTGRKPNGSFMGENENVLNAVDRNLSALSDAQIIQLREEARAFISACDLTLTERDMDDTSCYGMPQLTEEGIMETAKQALHHHHHGSKKEWSGSPCPLDPDNYWVDDETGERVSAVTGERRPYTQQELEKVLRLT